MCCAELGTRFFKSNDNIGTDTLLKKYRRYSFEKVTTISLLGTFETKIISLEINFCFDLRLAKERN